MSPAKQPPSPLGALGVLPAELRNAIYKLALTTSELILISRSRHPNPARRHTFGPKLPKYVYKCSGTTLARPGKSKRGRCFVVTDVLAMSLLRAGKAIAAEATLIFYGSNTFRFCSRHAFAVFMDQIQGKADMIAFIKVSGSIERVEGPDRKYLKRMAAPKRVEIQTILRDLDRDVEATEAAREMWSVIKAIVSTQDVLLACETSRVTVDLPEEVQLQRLNALVFALDTVHLLFEQEKDGVTELVTFDTHRRCRQEFKALLIDLLRQDAAKARRLEEAKQEYIAEKLRGARALKQP